ncbi:phage holin family protein [Sphingobacterium hungaricum]|uniref:phage holin family protein n=1 Tax=Sphingobacterium hungaricum TaxID=2082723 RepID=UPI0018C9A1E9|nr:phage holin family protein [Sphingobacterium hungaricum]
MEDQKFSFSGTIDKAKEYVDTRIELLRLRAIAKSSRILGALILDLAKIILTLFIVFFFSMALGFYFSELFDSYSLGFLTTGGVFVIILLIIRAFEPKLELKFMNLTISKIFGKLDEEEDHINESQQPVEDDINSVKEKESELYNEEAESNESKKY